MKTWAGTAFHLSGKLNKELARKTKAKGVFAGDATQPRQYMPTCAEVYTWRTVHTAHGTHGAQWRRRTVRSCTSAECKMDVSCTLCSKTHAMSSLCCFVPCWKCSCGVVPSTQCGLVHASRLARAQQVKAQSGCLQPSSGWVTPPAATTVSDVLLARAALGLQSSTEVCSATRGLKSSSWGSLGDTVWAPLSSAWVTLCERHSAQLGWHCVSVTQLSLGDTVWASLSSAWVTLCERHSAQLGWQCVSAIRSAWVTLCACHQLSYFNGKTPLQDAIASCQGRWSLNPFFQGSSC